jgi:DnaJ-class molecular chaperone
MDTDRNVYEILNVDINSTLEDIKKQYKVLVLKYHPDRNGGNAEKFKEIKNAYDILSNEDKRYEYDSIKVSKTNISNIHDIFGSMFNANTDEQQKIKIVVNIEDVLYGCYKSYTMKSLYPCVSCKMTGIMDPDRNTIQCRECFGKGTNPMMAFLSCITCNGKGVFVINNKICKDCGGKKQLSTTTIDKIYLKPGIKNNEIISITNSIILFIEHETYEGISICDLDIHLYVEITLLELLCGFVKEITYGHEHIIVQSKHVFKFDEEVVLENKGINEKGDMYLHFQLNIEDIEDTLYKKLGNSLNLLLKKDLSFRESSNNSTVIDVN